MIKWIGIATTLFASVASAAIQYELSTSSEATFEAVGRPSLLKIRGKGAKVKGQLELEGRQAKGRFYVALTEFDTGIELRNQHMKEKYLETAKFPQAVLEIENLNLPDGFTPGKDVSDLAFTGKLTLKGETKPVNGSFSVVGAKMKTVAEFTFSLKDYPIGVPSHFGVVVADQVKVRVELPELKGK